ncbi:MAG: glycosyltransferase [Promethearchaeota archaeon]
MRDIVWIGRYRGHGGFATATREYFKALKLFIPRLKLASLEVLDVDDPLAKFVAPMPLDDDALLILNHLPVTDPGAQVYLSVTEYDSVPEEWVEIFNDATLIFTQSSFCKGVFSKQIDDPSKIHVVPYILPGNITPGGPATRDAPADRFVFGSVFEWVPRKAPERLIEAFVREFSPEEPVRLLIRSTHPSGRDIQGLVLDLSADPRLIAIPRVIEDIGAFYRGLDAYISPTAGEGYGQTLNEAMACGVPTIGSNHGGNLDFMNDENSYLVQVEEWEPGLDHLGNPIEHKWRMPRIESIMKNMRTVYEQWKNGESLKVVPDLDEFRGRFTRARVGKMLHDCLQEYFSFLNQE